MKNTFRLFILICGWIAFQAGAAFGEAVPSGNSIIEKLRQNQNTSGFRARAKVESKKADVSETTAQILLKGRREGDLSQTLLLAMWPSHIKGEAVIISQKGRGERTGVKTTPLQTTRSMSKADWDAPLFGTELSIDDVAESFWNWPDHATLGAERLDREDCWVIESKNPISDGSLAAVKSWISSSKVVPVKIEKFDKAGRLVSRTTFDRLTKREGGGWVPAAFKVENLLSGTTSEVAFSRGDRDLTFPPEDFTPEGIRQLVSKD